MKESEMTDTTNLFHVIDYADGLVIYSGTYEECVMVQDTQYAGLTVIHDTDFRQYGTEYFTTVYLLPPDTTKMTWVLCIKTPEAYIQKEFPSALNALSEGLDWLNKRGFEPTVMDIPFRPKR